MGERFCQCCGNLLAKGLFTPLEEIPQWDGMFRVAHVEVPHEVGHSAASVVQGLTKIASYRGNLFVHEIRPMYCRCSWSVLCSFVGFQPIEQGAELPRYFLPDFLRMVPSVTPEQAERLFQTLSSREALEEIAGPPDAPPMPALRFDPCDCGSPHVHPPGHPFYCRRS